NGQFQLQPYVGNHLELYVYPPEQGPNLGVHKELTWPKGKVKATLNVQLPQGIIVTGRVAEEPSGNKVAGARILFEAEVGPGLDRDVLLGGSAPVYSDKDGKFQITVPPVSGHLMVQGPTKEYVSRLFYHDVFTGKIGPERGFPRYYHGSARVELKPGAIPDE